MQISIIRVLLKTPLRVLSVYPCSRRICPKNATGFVAQRSRLHWHLKQASLPNEASFIFSGYFLDMIISVGFRVTSYQDGSLQVVRKFRTVRKEGNRMVTRNMDYYNLDMIKSVGFCVNSHQGIRFRQWANNVLKEYLLRGYTVHQQMLQMEQRIDSKLMLQHDEMQRIKDTQAKQQQQLDFFIRTSTPPAEMVFFEGDFYIARVALENLVRSANHRVIIIDGYVSSLTMSVLDVRKP